MRCDARAVSAKHRRTFAATLLDGDSPLIEPQLTGISPLALGLEGYEEARIPGGIVFYRQGWWCRVQ